MVISAEDGGGLTAPVNARVNISVVGSSVASPVFEQAQYFFTVSEDVLRGTSVGVVRAAAAKTGEELWAFKNICRIVSFFPAVCQIKREMVLCFMIHLEKLERH